MGRQFLAAGDPRIRGRLLLPLAILALVAALFGSGVVQRAHATPPIFPDWDIVGVHQFQVCTSSTPCTSSSPDIIGTGTMTISTEDPVTGELTGYADIYVNGHHIHVPATATLTGNALGNFQPDPVEGWTIDGHDQSERPTWDVSGGFLDGTIDPSTGLFSGGAYVTYDAPDGDGSLIGPLGIDFSPLDVYCSTTCYVNGNTGSDLTGDGSQAHPFATIQTAVNVVNSGGTVIVSNATYNESVNVDHPVTLKGYKAGWDARYRTPSFGGETIVSPDGGPAFYVTADNVTIDGFTVTNAFGGVVAGWEGGGPCQYGEGEDCTVNNLAVINDIFRNNAVGLSIAPNIEVAGLTVQHDLFDQNNQQTPPENLPPVGGIGIAVQNGYINGGTIDANAFTGNTTGAFVMLDRTDGACGSEGPAACPRADGLSLTNNSSTGDGSFAVLEGFMNCDYDPACIANNTVKNATGDAISIGDESGEISIANNTFTSGAGAGIAETSEDSGELYIHDNTFSMNQYGINLQAGGEAGIYHNTFKANRTAAIAVGADYNAEDLEINDNSIAGNFAGITNANEDQFDATCNWWGTNAGPRSINNPGGYGDSVSGLDRDSFTPWLTSSNLNFPCDSDAPTITITTPTATNYRLHQSVRPVFRCADTGGSGIASCAVTEGGSNYAVNTSTAGTNLPFTVTATDKAGNTYSETVYYSVGAPV